MISNNYFKGFTLNVSPLCQGCELIDFADKNDIMFHQCEICREEYNKAKNKRYYYECPWCGNRWYQEEQEPHRCEVCKHFIWEGTPDEYMKFPDLEVWNEFLEERRRMYGPIEL